MKISYKYRILGCFLFIFVLFTISIVLLEQDREKKYKTEALEARLDGYAETIHKYISTNNLTDSTYTQLNAITNILPDAIRLTVVDNGGNVLFDKDVKDIESMENHSDRPEIKSALFQQHGTNIRTSASTNHEYLYYARHFPSYFVRVALPYDMSTISLLKADNYFIYITLLLFVGVLIFLYFVANRFGKSISQLKQFSIDIRNGKSLSENIYFPDDELGDIAKELAKIFNQKTKTEKALKIETEKLIQHFQYSEEGLGIFDASHKKIYANSHFIQYTNLIIEKSSLDVEDLLKDEKIEPITQFIESKDKSSPLLSIQISVNGKIYLVKAIVFEDKSFEITIKDITKTEKNRILKQEMTSNIAHELRTPVTCLRGFLEILNENDVPKEKRTQFTEKAYLQSIRLSELIDDISLLSKIEESAVSFKFQRVELTQLIDNVRIDVTDKLELHHIKFVSAIKDHLAVDGNYGLLYSVFLNLVNNSIKYGGDNIEIHIDCSMETDRELYLSYYDTGAGVEEQHLNRLFERFYRVGEGRTRNTGGSGLGLSIVRNTILLHKGDIQVKKHISGGLEFLIRLNKYTTA